MGMKLIERGTGYLGRKKLHTSDSKKGKQKECKQDNPHSPEPLDQAPPEQDSVGEIFNVIQYGGSGGGEARDGLKKCIGEVGN